MDPNEEHEILKKCHDNGVTIYPVQERGVWYIQANNGGRKTTYRKKELYRGHSLRMTLKIKERVLNCYQHWYNKITNNE